MQCFLAGSGKVDLQKIIDCERAVERVLKADVVLTTYQVNQSDSCIAWD